jgi:hypothetical protein
MSKKVIRCQSDKHQTNGNILVALSDKSIFVKCNNGVCKSWTKITLNIPGLRLDLSEAGITQEVLPDDYHLHLENATSVVVKK